MDISDTLLAMYSANLREDEGRYVLEVPAREVNAGTLSEGDVYRVAVFKAIDTDSTDSTTPERVTTESKSRFDDSEPPVTVGETRSVTIEDLGTQGDGIARVERGYVIIVPDTSVGDEVDIKITEARDTVGFGTVVSS